MIFGQVISHRCTLCPVSYTLCCLHKKDDDKQFESTIGCRYIMLVVMMRLVRREITQFSVDGADDTDDHDGKEHGGDDDKMTMMVR